jgi:hypothetical protein
MMTIARSKARLTAPATTVAIITLMHRAPGSMGFQMASRGTHWKINVRKHKHVVADRDNNQEVDHPPHGVSRLARQNMRLSCSRMDSFAASIVGEYSISMTLLICPRSEIYEYLVVTKLTQSSHGTSTARTSHMCRATP